ncbi:MAG: insulinase family protein [Chloroflexi bacterium]|nr:insulinase family protein [Chloroflexota bacterium]MBV9893008.1 insulinase family protein [Chloroflexota bacterium]
MALSVSASASFQQTVLDNGLRVILREVRERPLVGVWMWYRVGGRNELPGTTGVSHWVEHMLFKGGKRFGKGEITKEISRRGGALNAFTWIDCTAYFETLPASEIDLALSIEADRIYDTRIEPDEAEAERTVVISEREGSENYPEFWLREEVQAVAWREHPYRLGVIGPKSDLRAMTREDLYQHYKRYYMTNNASLVMVGDFETARLLDKIRAEFDALPGGPSPAALQVEEQPQTGERRVTVRRPGPTHYIMLGYHAPEASHADAASMVVLSSVLGGASSPIAWGGARGLGRSSRLYRALIDGELATSVSASYELTLDPYLFAIDATLRDGVEPARAEAAILKELERIQKDGVPDEELARTKRQLHAQVVYSLEGVTNQGFALGFMDLVAKDASAWETFPEALQSVTADDIQRVASRYLVERQRTVGWFVPEEEAQ